MIISKLAGGLGNQMFQYAAGRALSHRLQAPFYLDASSLPWEVPARTFDLPELQIRAGIATPEMLATSRATGRGRLDWLRNALSKTRRYAEPHFHVDHEFFRLHGSRLLHGYFQSEQYFHAIRETIRVELQPCAPLAGLNLQTATEIASGPSVSLHVRRGDYASDEEVRRRFGLLPLSYYERAEALLRDRVGAFRVFIFSDDPDWAQANLRLASPVTLVSHNGDRSWEDMRLMSRCDHHIIANSTFSWWGAWLNAKPDRIVVAPQTWFFDSPHSTSDLLPADWIRL